jgi:hypothetical protein
MWMPPDVAVAVAASPAIPTDGKWVRDIACWLVELGAILPAWATAGSRPAVLIYPALGFLEDAARQNNGLHVNTRSRNQAVHIDQAVGCAVHINFAVPSKGRCWTTVYKVSERECVKFCARYGGDTLEALERRGREVVLAQPDGGATALAFSSATPHFGAGGDIGDPQSSMVFFAGVGAAATLSREGTPSHKYYTGLLASGGQRDCNADGVVPLADLVDFAQSHAFTSAARPAAVLKVID